MTPQDRAAAVRTPRYGRTMTRRRIATLGSAALLTGAVLAGCATTVQGAGEPAGALSTTRPTPTSTPTTSTTRPTTTAGGTVPRSTAGSATSTRVTPSSPTTSYTAIPVPAGYAQTIDTEGHFSISVPSTWVKIDLSSAVAQQAVDQALQQYPELKKFFTSAADLKAQGVRLLAVNPATSATLNVVTTPAPSGYSDAILPVLAQAAKAQLEKAGATVGQPTIGTVANHSAATYTYTLAGSAGAQSLLLANSKAYFVTFTNSPAEQATILSTFAVD